MNESHQAKMKIFNVGGGLNLSGWKLRLNMQDVVNKYNYEGNDYPNQLNHGDRTKNWFGLRNRCSYGLSKLSSTGSCGQLTAQEALLGAILVLKRQKVMMLVEPIF